MGFGYAYDPAGTRCTSGPTPGAQALLAVVLDAFVELRSLGIYNCRPVRGGTTLSLHGEGRAIDFGADPADRAAQNQGHLLAGVLVDQADALGVQEVIWHRRRWTSRSRRWTDYGGVNPHTDHVHVGLCWAAARSLTAVTVRAALRLRQPTTPPPPPPGGTTYMLPTLDLTRAHLSPVRHTSPVRKLQGLLLAHGYDLGGYSIDGVAGGITRSRVLRFQSAHRLPADAIVGPRTWRALIEQ
jgi:hypothetical protein